MLKNKKVKVIVLFSGGLDSTLAIKVLKKQKIEVLALIFRSYFFSGEQAIKMSEELDFSFRIFDFSEEHLKMVKKPENGYGKAMNPCIDCHSLMLIKAKEVMIKEKFDFVATGEVLGERPMSQNLRALKVVEKLSSLNGYLLRPLSAKLLEPTIPEKLGLVKRDELLDISGRTRKRQIALAKKFNVKNYPSPAGGCLLTDLTFGKRLKKLFAEYPNCNGNDIDLLKVGRHFWENKYNIIIGRNEEENKKIEKLKMKGDILVLLKDFSGPLAIIRNYDHSEITKNILNKAKKLVHYYSIKARDEKCVEFEINR